MYARVGAIQVVRDTNMSEDQDGFVTRFHHTDTESAKKIIKSGLIRQSKTEDGDAVYGDGTYVTKKGPGASRSEVAKNNYDGTTSYWRSKQDKTAVAIEFKLPASKVEKCDTSSRDVHIVAGDLHLKDAKGVKVHVRDPKGKGHKTYTL